MFSNIKQVIIIAMLLWHSILHADTTTHKIIIPYPPGGGVDVIFRLFQQYAKRYDVHLVPEYKPGAQGQIGIGHADKNNTHLFTIISDVRRYNNSQTNLIPIGAIATNIFVVVVNGKSNIHNMDQLASLIKTSPDGLNWATGSAVLEQLSNSIAREISQLDNTAYVIPFNGAGAALTSILGRSTDVAILPGSVAKTAIDAGLLRKLAVWYNTNTCDRYALFPSVVSNVSTVSDGYGMYMAGTAADRERLLWAQMIANFHQDTEIAKQLQRNYLIKAPAHIIFGKN